jgi:hypothetical protein
MVETSFGLFFFLKKPKNATGINRYIYLRITVDGVSANSATKRIWDKTRCFSQSGRASGTEEDARALNSYPLNVKVKRFLSFSSNQVRALYSKEVMQRSL